MFVKNLWYCAGWDDEFSQSKNSLVARRIAGESVVLYRKPDGGLVVMEDRCCHRQAPLSKGMKEGDSLRCGYHGMRFGPDGRCIEIPGQSNIPPNAVVRTFPVVEKHNWVWVWMGDPAKADSNHICYSQGPSDPNWNIKTSKVRINTNHRLEIANLMDLSHVAWIHRDTLGGTDNWFNAPVQHTTLEHGVRTELWMPNSPPPSFAKHLFPASTQFDIWAGFDMTLPCNFIMNFQVWSPGTALNGKSNGQLILDTFSSQAVTPSDEDWVDYYYSWGASKATDVPGLSDMLLESTHLAFREDQAMLEAQHRNIKERPHGNLVDIKADLGPNKLLWLLDKRLREEAAAQAD